VQLLLLDFRESFFTSMSAPPAPPPPQQQYNPTNADFRAVLEDTKDALIQFASSNNSSSVHDAAQNHLQALLTDLTRAVRDEGSRQSAEAAVPLTANTDTIWTGQVQLQEAHMVQTVAAHVLNNNHTASARDAALSEMQHSLRCAVRALNRSQPASTILQLLWPSVVDEFAGNNNNAAAMFQLPYILRDHAKAPFKKTAPDQKRRRLSVPESPPEGWMILYSYFICRFAMEVLLQEDSLEDTTVTDWKRRCYSMVPEMKGFSTAMETAQALYLLDFAVDCSNRPKLEERVVAIGMTLDVEYIVQELLEYVVVGAAAAAAAFSERCRSFLDRFLNSAFSFQR